MVAALGLWFCCGCHVIIPFVVMFAFVGELLVRKYVNGSTGTSPSVAVFVTVSVINSFTVCAPMFASVGPLWTAAAVNTNEFVAVNIGFTRSKLSLLLATVEMV